MVRSFATFVQVAWTLVTAAATEETAPPSQPQLRGTVPDATVSPQVRNVSQETENEMHKVGEDVETPASVGQNEHGIRNTSAWHGMDPSTAAKQHTQKPLVISNMSADSESNSGVSCSYRGQTIDMIWPGSGYASIACGGIWKALKQCGWHVNMIMCSSGGAASALLVLAGEPRGQGLQVLEKTYKQFDSDGGLLVQPRSRQGCTCENGACPAIDCYWQEVYAQLLGDAASFANFNRKARISLQCKSGGFMVLYNFKSVMQAAQAVAAAGNGGQASQWIEGLNDYCWDADASKLSEGIPTKFNPQNLPVYYYYTDSFAFSRTCYGVGWTFFGYQCTDKQVNAGYQDFDSSSLWQRNPSWNGHNYNFGLFTWKDLSASSSWR